ncbi:MAG: GIY-YIG nuclease family protein [Verrucomicrobia bacterium]|nr:GIY-YIG nuclease family protein [Verrucomicrobiota bacterium]
MKAGVYLLEFETGKYYLGSTHDLELRFRQHQAGLVYSTARLGREPRIVAFQETGSVAEARRLERRYKSWKNHKKVLMALQGAAPT